MGINADQINAATQEFIASTPESAAYLTNENLEKIAAYVQGAFPDAVASPAAYEIAFRDLLAKGKLKRVPGYLPPLTDEERAWVRDTPSYQARDLYKNDKKFRAVFDALAEEEAELKKDPWVRLDAKTYANMDPNHAAQLYVDNPQFASAVQRLIDRGEI